VAKNEKCPLSVAKQDVRTAAKYRRGPAADNGPVDWIKQAPAAFFAVLREF
jgi:hypothetical protein